MSDEKKLNEYDQQSETEQNLQTEDNKTNCALYTQEQLKEIVKEAIKEYKENEEKAPLTDSSTVKLCVMAVIYIFLTLIAIVLTIGSVVAGASWDVIVTIVAFDMLILLLIYEAFCKKNRTNGKVEQHFSLLVAIASLILAMLSLSLS